MKKKLPPVTHIPDHSRCSDPIACFCFCASCLGAYTRWILDRDGYLVEGK